MITVNTHRISQSFEEAEQTYPASMPKYLKLCEVIQTLINNQEYQPGDKLPTETDLVEALPVAITNPIEPVTATDDSGGGSINLFLLFGLMLLHTTRRLFSGMKA